MKAWIRFRAGLLMVGAVAAAVGWAAQPARAEQALGSIDVLSLQAAPPAGRVYSVADGTTVRIRGFGIWSAADGEFDFTDEDIPLPGGAIRNIDLEDTLGMDLDQFTGGGLIGFNLGAFHLDFSYNGFYDYEGDRDVGTIVFDDQVYTGRVITSAQVHEGAVNLRYDLWTAETVDLTLSTDLGVRVFYVEAEAQETLTGQEDSVEFWAPVPSPGVSLRWGITENLFVRGTAAGFYAGDLATYYDLSAELGYDINRNLGLFVGYRHWALEVEYDDDALDFSNGAIYAGVEVRL